MSALGYFVPEFPNQTHIWMWREIVALRRAGVRVRLISTRRPGVDACRHAFAEEARGETTYVYPPGVADGWGALLRGGRVLRYAMSLDESGAKEKMRAVVLSMCAMKMCAWAKREGVGHVHVHSAADAAHVAALAERMGGPGFSVTLHGDLEVYGRDHGKKFARAAFIATAGRHLIDSVVKLGVDPARVMSLPMGVETDTFTPRAWGEEAHDGVLRLVTVARLHRCKGHVHTFEAMRRLLDEGILVEATLVGEGPHRSEIEADVSRLGLGERVKLTGSLGEAGVREAMGRADAFVLTSVGAGEASPVGVMEAMSSGLPVVVSVIGSTPDMVRDGVDGFLVRQGDVDGIARALRALSEDRAMRRRMGERARERAVEQFDAGVGAMRLLEAIERHGGLRLRQNA